VLNLSPKNHILIRIVTRISISHHCPSFHLYGSGFIGFGGVQRKSKYQAHARPLIIKMIIRLTATKIGLGLKCRFRFFLILRGLGSCFFLIDSEGNLHAADR